MRLSVLERIHLLGILPAEGTFVTLKIVRQLREDLSFSEEEIKRLGIEQDGQQVRWNANAEEAGGTEIPIGEKATDVVVERLKKMDQEGKLTLELVGVYERVVGGAGYSAALSTTPGISD